jgi:hypothetical protein
MKTALVLFASLWLLATTSCKKDTGADHQISFIEPSGTANGNGEYTIQGQITSPVRLDRVLLTKQGQSTPFIEDNTTAKNKTEHTFSYQVTGIMQDTYSSWTFTIWRVVKAPPNF